MKAEENDKLSKYLRTEMTLKRFLAVLVTTLLCRSKCIGATQCYNCSTLSDSTCSDPFSSRGRNSFICSDGRSCVKVKTDYEVRRGCIHSTDVSTYALESNQGENCVTDVVPPSFERRTICRCGTNLCNTAYKIDAGVSGIVLAVFTSLLIWVT